MQNIHLGKVLDSGYIVIELPMGNLEITSSTEVSGMLEWKLRKDVYRTTDSLRVTKERVYNTPKEAFDGFARWLVVWGVMLLEGEISTSDDPADGRCNFTLEQGDF